MTSPTIEQMCRDLLDTVPKLNTYSRFDLPHMMTKLEEIIDGVRASEQSDLLQKLRPLVWEDHNFGASAESVCGRYEVEECQSFVTGVYYRWSLRRGRDAWIECDSIEQGKRLCEADYRSRVRALFE